MAKWTRFLLAGGVTPDGYQLIDPAVLGDMFTAQFTVGLTPRQNILKPFFPGSSFQPDYGYTWYGQAHLSLAPGTAPGKRDLRVLGQRL